MLSEETNKLVYIIILFQRTSSFNDSNDHDHGSIGPGVKARGGQNHTLIGQEVQLSPKRMFHPTNSYALLG